MSFERLSEGVEGKVPAAVVQVEGRSTVEDRRPRNSYHRVCYMFGARVASACHWSWTAVGDDQRPTEGDSRLIPDRLCIVTT